MGWVPYMIEPISNGMTQDYGDGGAYPEIQVAQYPLEMGNPRKRAKDKSNAVEVKADNEGRISFYNSLFQQRHAHGEKKQLVYSTMLDLLPPGADPNYDPYKDPELVIPGEEEIEALTAKTKAALEKVGLCLFSERSSVHHRMFFFAVFLPHF